MKKYRVDNCGESEKEIRDKLFDLLTDNTENLSNVEIKSYKRVYRRKYNVAIGEDYY